MLDSSTIITITDLPLTIQKKLPYSIRTRKNTYTFDELPYDIQDMIENYYVHKKDVSYNQLLDCTTTISQYGDLEVIGNVYDLVTTYLQNYLLVTPLQYPFDPTFGCRLKYYLQKLDTDLQYKLISTEIQNIANTLSNDLSINIELKDLSIDRLSPGGENVEYNCRIVLLINNQEKSIITTVVT